MSKPYIICVDDERTVLDALATQLKASLGNDYMFEQAESAEEALQLMEEIQELHREVAVIISDQMMPGMKGHELLAKVHEMSPDTMKILLTGITTTEELGKALNEAKLYRYITKPWEKYDLQMTVEEATKTYQQRAELREHARLMELLVEAGQEIAKEVSTNDLARTLLCYMSKGSAADRGGIILYGNDGQLLENMFFERKGDEVECMDDLSLFPPHLTKVVGKCDEPLLMLTPNANTVISEEYLQTYKPRSIYTRALWHGEQLAGIIYLESQLRKHNFTPNRLKFIELLNQQAAVSITRLKVLLGLEHTVEERTREISKQKKTIEDKNKDLMDSIQYAQRLQKSFMPKTDMLQDVLDDVMLLYKPKSMISGDFYWWRNTESHVHLAIVDCTGHGVPGGMLSILGLNLLNQLVIQDELVHPEEVLLHMNQYFQTRFARTLARGGSKNLEHYDSMDIALISLNKATGKMEFAGARRPLYLVREGKLIKIKGDSFSLGGSGLLEDSNYTFSREVLQLHPGDEIYMFSDGFVDQFGGPRDKKFTPKRFRELVLAHSQKPMTDIREMLHSELEKWRGENEQTDDVLVFGFRYHEQYAGWKTTKESQLAKKSKNSLDIPKHSEAGELRIAS